MYCRNCGKEVGENADYCVHCGVSLREAANQNAVGGSDFSESSAKWLGVLSFFVPLVGLILFIIYDKKSPSIAKYAVRGAVIGVIVRLVLYMISVVLEVLFSVSLIGLIFTNVLK
jgi:hypothetical protein